MSLLASRQVDNWELERWVLCLVVQTCLTLCDHMDCSLPGSSVHGDSSGKNTRVGSHALLYGIFPVEIKHRSPTL